MLTFYSNASVEFKFSIFLKIYKQTKILVFTFKVDLLNLSLWWIMVTLTACRIKSLMHFLTNLSLHLSNKSIVSCLSFKRRFYINYQAFSGTIPRIFFITSHNFVIAKLSYALDKTL